MWKDVLLIAFHSILLFMSLTLVVIYPFLKIIYHKAIMIFNEIAHVITNVII